jgi:hypothetical protein
MPAWVVVAAATGLGSGADANLGPSRISRGLLDGTRNVTTLGASVGSSFAGNFPSVKAVLLRFTPRLLFKLEGAAEAMQAAALLNITSSKCSFGGCDRAAEGLR